MVSRSLHLRKNVPGTSCQQTREEFTQERGSGETRAQPANAGAELCKGEQHSLPSICSKEHPQRAVEGSTQWQCPTPSLLASRPYQHLQGGDARSLPRVARARKTRWKTGMSPFACVLCDGWIWPWRRPGSVGSIVVHCDSLIAANLRAGRPTFLVWKSQLRKSNVNVDWRNTQRA